MPDFESRLDAVERALTDDDRGPADLADAAEATDRLAACEARLDEFEERLADLEAAVQAVRGYVGQARREDRELERTAEAALSTAERVERRLDELGSRDPKCDDSPLGGADTVPQPLPATEPDEEADGPLARLREAL